MCVLVLFPLAAEPVLARVVVKVSNGTSRLRTATLWHKDCSLEYLLSQALAHFRRLSKREVTTMSVERICQRDIDTARPDESCFQAAERMHQRTSGALVVVDHANVPIGIVTDRDLTVRVIAAQRDPYTTSVREVMTPRPKTVSEMTEIESVLSLMQAGEFRRVPVVNDLGHLVGIVTLDDVLLLFSEGFTLIGRLLEQETPQAAAMPKA
jgi:CBS domain-containing protein